ncbi:hypothetical protein, partial [Bacillus altitudinis]|uniref:hypothetical protein n=1 Tax=Bacillus altitudinis TaxID=293387 RepID=UPI001C9314AE
IGIGNIEVIEEFLLCDIVIGIEIKVVLMNDGKGRKMIEEEWRLVEIDMWFEKGEVIVLNIGNGWIGRFRWEEMERVKMMEGCLKIGVMSICVFLGIDL